jgi:type VI secretion system secreted protein VgrG
MSDATDFIVSLLRKDAHRLLKLYFPHDDGPSSGLLVNHLVAEESLSRDFTFTVTVLSDDPNIELTDVQGRMVCVEVLREVGPSRYFNGYCFEFCLKRVDNGLAIYEMILKPWLAQFRLRHNYHLFHNLNITEQTKQLFRETGLSSHEFRMNQSDPVRTFSCQYNETDYNYLHRRWEEMGWHYWYEHTLGGHKLILSDTSPDAAAIDGKPLLAYHHDGGSNKHDKIANWSPGRKIVSGEATHGSFDFKRPSPQSAGVSSNAEQGDIHRFEVYQYEGLYGFRHAGHGGDIARLRMDAIDAPGKQFEARGNSRAVQPGRWFCLNKDFAGQMFDAKDADVEFFIVNARHEVDNNYLNASGAHASYENSFTCVPRSIAWRPEPGRNSTAVKVNGVDTAIVVGSGGQDIYTDEFGRIRVQFHWDRKGRNEAGSSAWVRVASNWAGAEQGVMALPRIGSEVIVQWLSGNPDRPIVTGGVYNARKMPPWQLPSQQALMGLRSRELTPGGGNAALGRSNHLILDDTHEKIQAQLKSDHQSSQLSLGHITRIESNAGRKDYRGEGWELTSNAWGVARAGKGMLISTDARNNAVSHIKDMGETIQRLKDAYNIHDELAESALKYKALEKKEQQGVVVDAIKLQNKGVQGAGSEVFPQLSEPHLVLSSPAGIETATAHSTHITSDQHTAITTGKNLSIASGESFYASIAKTFRLFVQQMGMKMVAAAGNIDIQALNDSINVLAKLNITHTANKITISAKEEVVINAAGSYVKFNAGGIEHGTKGKNVSHAVTHSLVGPKGLEAVRQDEFEKMKPKKFSQQVFVDEALWKLSTGAKKLKYKVISETVGVLGSGMLDGKGKTKQIFSESNDPLKVVIDVADGKWDRIMTERPPGLSEPAGESVIFDYHDHPEEGEDEGEEGEADGVDGVSDHTDLGSLKDQVLGAAKDAVKAGGHDIEKAATDSLTGLKDELKHKVAGQVESVLGSTVGDAAAKAILTGQNPLKTLEDEVKGKVLEQVSGALGSTITDVLAKSIASGNHDPLRALEEGVKQKVIAEAVDLVGSVASDALGEITKDIFKK